ncbi:glucan 1,4-alpha-glucosidase [Pseudoalteromonas ruthenica]|nr:glucan 1,4-alpha-glucosidase [Pseudoalteromonas ruthenica]TMO88412.1 glucan 1,4-alpha-glucosidase [Pseudoalteromonas ruthenica]TMO93225.1 glucan 1,4-alpha-glucosidase [Pseudoalteromonas ruthenica]TMP00682.1 glucan 1,4-alpha-glucosidase [Pseudoalteromonas ruthenica]TMP12090.1 glucan 1,4-alpha-glucosidase [Pseudoalteromonas ruthenica]TMP13088.1 glucan 1,4-alpha-glucosidase [Pseudoalteromonas ruthenica]
MVLATVAGCNSAAPTANSDSAPGAPGDKPFWAYSGKTGIGTSYEAYQQGRYDDNSATGTVSKVWFSLAKGMITETMFGLIHQAQIRDMQFIVSGEDFVVAESDGLSNRVEYLDVDPQGRPTSLAYRVTSEDSQGRFRIIKDIFTDPDAQSLMVRVRFQANEPGLRAHVQVNPYVNNDGVDDRAKVADDALIAYSGAHYLSLQSAKGLSDGSVGFVGQSDRYSQLKARGEFTRYQSTGEQAGNVAMSATLGEISENSQFDLVLSYGSSEQEALAQGQKTLKRGYDKVLAHYNGDGDAIGWQDYLQSLQLERLYDASTDGGKLLNTSALVLKAQEDKTHAGALIASLSNPWGDTVAAEQGHTGYKAVWVRDFYQVAMAFLAMGDTQTAKAAFNYLPKVQVREDTPGNQGDTGWFLQKTHVDGELEWVGVQLDQTAMPIMLAWKLYKGGVLSKNELTQWYRTMLQPAADFLVEGGLAKILWNDTQISPPYTQQERWEEQAGYSPSTTAAVVAGLISAGEIAKLSGDTDSAQRYLATAKQYEQDIEALMFTSKGTLTGEASDGRYFVRIAQDENTNGDTRLAANNGRAGMDKKQILDGGFLELVRYGVRGADSESVMASLPEYDDQSLVDNLRVKYTFTDEQGRAYPGWRRYGNDGYGEDEKRGSNYAEGGNNTDGQRGRVWPFFTGERGHYEIAAANAVRGGVTAQDYQRIQHTYVFGMEAFANKGMMLPEQVWDGVGVNPFGYELGEGTNSATPLAWTHAEYVKLLRSLTDKTVWDHYPIVEQALQ